MPFPSQHREGAAANARAASRAGTGPWQERAEKSVPSSRSCTGRIETTSGRAVRRPGRPPCPAPRGRRVSLSLPPLPAPPAQDKAAPPPPGESPPPPGLWGPPACRSASGVPPIAAADQASPVKTLLPKMSMRKGILPGCFSHTPWRRARSSGERSCGVATCHLWAERGNCSHVCLGVRMTPNQPLDRYACRALSASQNVLPQ